MTVLRPLCVAVFLVAGSTGAANAQAFDARIVDRHVSDTDYSYVVPARLHSESNSNVNCFGFANSVNCKGSTTTTGSVTPARRVAYQVQGATLALQLPNRLVVVVNCESKYALGHRILGGLASLGSEGRAAADRAEHRNRRSCRIPPVDDIQVEFNGDNAKLKWPVSLDGKKTESETYKVLAVL